MKHPRHGPSAGVLAAFAALGLAQFAAGFSPRLRSPILDVGDRVIDSVPSAVKEFAIDTFGTADKPALLIGIGVFLVAYAAVVGTVAVRYSRAWGVAGIGLFGVIGILAALGGPAGPIGVVPSALGAVAGITTLLWLTRPPDAGTGTDESRRNFLYSSGAIALSAMAFGGVGFWADRRFEREMVSLPRASTPLTPIPPDVSFDTPGLSPFVTSNADFYRIDTALTVPRISTEDYTLKIKGMVDRSLTLSYSDLLSRRIVESDITLTCVSNEVGGNLLGNARWLGVRLDDLLAEAGIDPAADQVVGRSIDRYTCGFPVAALDGRDALVAIGMNGEPLPPEHGFPARLIVPGLYGYVSATKWLTEIELTRFDQFDHYWVDRGWAKQAPIKTQSRIDTPKALGRIPTGPTAIAGVAWAQTRGVARVEVKIDDGPWQEAELADELNGSVWRQWKMTWDATPGRHQITCRATDALGQTQPETRSRPIPDGATGWHSIVTLVDS